MREGDIALSVMPQSDGKIKLRPVLLLRKMPGFGDFLVCGVSSQLHQEVRGFDLVMDEKSPEYENSGLKSASVIRLGYLSVLPESKMKGSIGWLPDDTLDMLLQRLADYLVKTGR